MPSSTDQGAGRHLGCQARRRRPRSGFGLAAQMAVCSACLDDGERKHPPEPEAPPEARSATTRAVGKERSDWCRRELRPDARRAFDTRLFGLLGPTVVDKDLDELVTCVVWCGHGVPLVRLTAPARSDRGRLRAKRLTVHAPRDARRLDQVRANSAVLDARRDSTFDDVRSTSKSRPEPGNGAMLAAVLGRSNQCASTRGFLAIRRSAHMSAHLWSVLHSPLWTTSYGSLSQVYLTCQTRLGVRCKTL